MKRILFVLTFFVTAAALFAQAGGDIPRGQGPDGGGAASDHGLLIERVLPDSPAGAAGLVRGDILLELDGHPVNTIREVHRILAGHNAGDTVSAVILHGSDRRTVSIKLETRLYRPVLGLAFVAPAAARARERALENPRYRMPWGFSELFGAGAVVRSVTEGGPAAAAGVKVGDVIERVNLIAIDPGNSLSSVIDSLTPGQHVTLTIRRTGQQPVKLDVTLGTAPNGKALLGIEYSQENLPERMMIPPSGQPDDRPFGQFRYFWNPEAPGGALQGARPMPGPTTL